MHTTALNSFKPYSTFLPAPVVRMAGKPVRPNSDASTGELGMLSTAPGLPDVRAFITDLAKLLRIPGVEVQLKNVTKLVRSPQSYELLKEAPTKVLPYMDLNVVLQLEPEAFQAFSLEKFAEHVGVQAETITPKGKWHFYDTPLPPAPQLDAVPGVVRAIADEILGKDLVGCISPENGPILLYLTIKKQGSALDTTS